ncbi:hypothetical protein [uncultured Amnibacterium sp.]|uniref:hypothetical protein n=1 Tax=uncultured Amnibacterium sp. TaxID=1631851 RepID=UPI0035CB2B35
MSRVVLPRSRWTSRAAAVAFWLLAAPGVVVLVAAWVWFGASYLEEMTEQCKALAATTTMEGFGAGFGLLPLLVAHVLGLALLGPIATAGRSSTRSGIVYAVAAVVIASGIGVVVAEVLFEGTLFTMGAGAARCYAGVGS